MSESNAATWREPISKESLGPRLVETLLIVLVFFVAAGEPVPHNNEPHYLTRLQHAWCPTWGAGDLFLDSADAHVVFVWALGWVTKWLPLVATAWAGRLLAWSLLAWAWQRLSWRLVPLPLASVLSAALWVVLSERMNLAGEWVVGGVEAKCFAYVFVLLAIRQLVDEHWNKVWLLLGAATAFHAVVGGWSAVVCGGIWLAEHFGGRTTWATAVRGTIAGLIGGGVVALLGVVPAVALAWHESPELVAEANRIYVFERLPHHLALLTLPQSEVVQRLLRHSILLGALVCLVRAIRKPDGADDTDGLTRVTWFACGAALLAAAGFVIEIACWNEPLRAAALLKYYWFRLTDFAVPLAVALQVATLIAAGHAARRKWATWGLAAALAVPAWHLTTVAWQRAASPVPPADRRMRDYAAWVDLSDWVAANTPPDAVFITPRTAQSFKWRTGRPEVATWKDIPQDARSIVEWFARLRNLHFMKVGDAWLPLRSVGELGTDRVGELARQYGADYVVTEQRFPLALPTVYPNANSRNDEYVVYAVKY